MVEDIQKMAPQNYSRAFPSWIILDFFGYIYSWMRSITLS